MARICPRKMRRYFLLPLTMLLFLVVQHHLRHGGPTKGSTKAYVLNSAEGRAKAKLAMQKVHEYITSIQVPKNCSMPDTCSTQDAVMRLGFGHTIMRVTRCFGAALTSKQAFVWEGVWREYADVPVYEVLQATSSCHPNHPNPRYKNPHATKPPVYPLPVRCNPTQNIGCAGSPGVTVPASVPAWLLDVLHDAGLSEYDWDSALQRWLVRGSPDTIDYFEKQKKKVNYPRSVQGPNGDGTTNGVVSLHIRAGGDKFSNTPMIKFVNMIVELVAKAKAVSSRAPVPSAVYIATDNPVVVTTIRNLLKKDPVGKDLTVLALGEDSVSRTGKTIQHAFNLFAPKEKHRRARLAIMEVLTDVLLLAEADYLVGSCGSWISTTAAHVRRARMLVERGGEWHRPLMPEMPLCNGVESEVRAAYTKTWDF